MRLRRPLLSSAAALIALSTLAGFAARAEDAPQNAAPKAESSQPAAPAQAAGDENRKSSGSNDQSGPSNAKPTANQDGQGDKATHSTAGRAGTEEPGSHARTQNDAAALVNGALNVPGAPADSQTVPAKFSKRNDAIDHVPTMAMPILAFSNEQKRSIIDAVRGANAPVQSTSAKPAEELPIDVTMQDWPAAASDPAFAKIKYVQAQGRILLVEPTNRVVIGEIPN
jgi:hypothetical protein